MLFTKMKKINFPLLAVLFLMNNGVLAQGNNPLQKMKIFIDGLMKKMNLEEKIGQLNLHRQEILPPARPRVQTLPKK